MKKITCIIPAYNEGERITQVLQSVLASDRIDEIIVINDGSTDDTAHKIREFSDVIFIDKAQNEGKSLAVYDGLRRATGEYILMLDSDLVGLRTTHIDSLVDRVLSGKVDVAISLRENSLRTYRFFGLDYVSWERIFPRSLVTPEVLEAIGGLKWFGLEVFLNDLFVTQEYRIGVVDLPWVISPMKSKKRGRLKGMVGETRMICEVLSTVWPIDNVVQFYKMYKLIVR